MLYQQIQQLVAKDKLADAIQLLERGEHSLPDSAREEATLMAGRLSTLKHQQLRGSISHENAKLELNQIREAVLNLVRLYGRTPEESRALIRRRRLKWLVPAVGYLLLSGGLFWWFMQPQPAFPMTADLLLERVSFQYLDGPGNFVQGKLTECYWQNYSRVSIVAEQVQVDENNDQQWRSSQPLTGPLNIQANESIPGLGIRFGSAQLERLYLETGALLTFTHSEEDASLIQITIQQEAAWKSEWLLQDSLDIEVEMASLSGIPNISNMYGPGRLRVFLAAEQASEMQLYAHPGTSNLDVYFAEEFSPKGQHLLIAQPGFYQPLASVAIPSILGGNIKIGTADQSPWRAIELAEGEALDLYNAEQLALNSILFTKAGIIFRCEGEIGHLTTGRNHISRSPNRLEWWWYSKKMTLITMSIMFAGLALVLYTRIKT